MGYVKQGFKDGDVLDASQLVKIEQGIQDNETETAKKEERVVFSMQAAERIAGVGSGMYTLEFKDGSVYNDVATAIVDGKDVYIQIYGNKIFMNGNILLLPYAGIAGDGSKGFTYSATSGPNNAFIVSASLSTELLLLIHTPLITTFNDGTEVKY